MPKGREKEGVALKINSIFIANTSLLKHLLSPFARGEQGAQLRKCLTKQGDSYQRRELLL